MAPVSVDVAAVPNGIQKAPDVSIAELSPPSPSFDALQSLSIPKMGTTRELSGLTVTTRPGFGRSPSVAFEGRGTVHDFL